MTETDVLNEAMELIRKQLQEKKTAPAEMIAAAIVDRRQTPNGTDREWFVYCTYGYVRSVVRRAVRAFKGKPEEESGQQFLPTLEGFDYVQEGYTVDRGDKQIVVPTNQMTDLEIDGKVLFLETMSDTCRAHAEELRRYKAIRRNKRAA